MRVVGEAKYYCKKCGAEIKRTDEVCPNCGENLNEVGRKIDKKLKEQINLTLSYVLTQRKEDTIKIFGISIFIVMSIYMVQVIGYTFQKYVIENDNGLTSQFLNGIFGMLIWGFLLFIIVMASPPFRKFLFKMFGSNPEESETEK
jgi:hypothetical protein